MVANHLEEEERASRRFAVVSNTWLVEEHYNMLLKVSFKSNVRGVCSFVYCF